MRKLFFGFLFLFSLSVSSQTLKTVKELEKVEQKCLDKGDDGLACSLDYYKKMDALLNEVYNKLRANLSTDEKAKLKKEQQLWLKERDKYTKEQYDETSKILGTTKGDDFKTVLKHAEAEFVKERVKVLIKRL
ncbi:lysozyme inhibitor LprI family protein [Flavobacterium sp.]|uniref:lysozyme inhibitor LprI family protein n=1 Tax=Flavobacterium sp. TaxID=239 RepID=UPI0026152E70|nr:lysozyme inhibitor LprI family protein [Flavobacterium sp.]